jgi:hypothetical protein
VSAIARSSFITSTSALSVFAPGDLGAHLERAGGAAHANPEPAPYV